MDTQEGEPQRNNDLLFDIEAVVEHAYADLSGPTERVVRVELVAEAGNTRLCGRNRTITVTPAPPEIVELSADAGGPYATLLKQPVTFNGLASTTPNPPIVSYVWDFGGGCCGGGGPTPVNTYGGGSSPHGGTTISQFD